MHAIRVPRRASLPLMFLGLLCIAGCDSGGGGSESVTIRYAGNTLAYGVLIRSGDMQSLTTAAQGDPPCAMTEAAVAASCNGSIEASANGLRLALRGCYVEPGDALFTCDLPAARVEQLRSDATITAGCGCQDACPVLPTISLCQTNSDSCQPAATSASEKIQAVSTTTRTTNATTCPTCCDIDYVPDASVFLTSTQPLTEIELEFDVDPECSLSDLWCNLDDPSTWTHVFERKTAPHTLRYCLLSANSVEPAIDLSLMQCEKGGLAVASVVRALDANFEPITNLPTVVMK